MHLQIRGLTAQSPANLGAYLAVLEREGINILAVGGSNVEHGGEFAFAVEDDTEDSAIAALEAAGYKPRLVEVDHYWVTNRPGELLTCVADVARKNASTGRKIKDLAVGVADADGRVPIQVYSE